MDKPFLAGQSTLAAEDETAILEACRSDPAAFSTLYHRYLMAMYRYVYFRVGSRAETEDLVSQVFLAALEGMPQYRHRGYFAAWLFAIARRKIADFYRARQAQPLDSLAGDASAEDDPLSQVIADQELRSLLALVARQPEKDQELLRLRFAAGLSFDQIAALLKRSPAAVKMSLYRLLHRLEEQLESH